MFLADGELPWDALMFITGEVMHVHIHVHTCTCTNTCTYTCTCTQCLLVHVVMYMYCMLMTFVTLFGTDYIWRSCN